MSIKTNNTKKFMNLPLFKDYSSRREWESACWEKISKSGSLLNLLITFDERRDLVKRAAAINGIYSGKTYEKIGEELLISPQTISAVKKSLNEKTYRGYKERGKTERKKKVYSSGPKQKPKFEHAGKMGFYRCTKYGKIWIPF